VTRPGADLDRSSPPILFNAAESHGRPSRSATFTWAALAFWRPVAVVGRMRRRSSRGLERLPHDGKRLGLRVACPQSKSRSKRSKKISG